LKNKNTSTLSVIRDVNIVVALSSIIKKNRLIFREANTLNALNEMNRMKKAFYLFLMKISYKRAKYIIANSVDTKNDLIKNSIVKNEKKIVVINNPVIPKNVDSFISKDVHHKWLNDNYTTLLAVGKLRPQKNYPLLIKALKKLIINKEDLRLIIIGDGPEKKNITELINTLKIVDYVDIISYVENPYEYYKKADCFVLSSDWEGFGNVVVEALYSGAKVVVSDCPGGPKDIINQGEYGLLFKKGNLDSLIQAIRISISDDFINLSPEKSILEKYKIENVSKSYSKLL
jgi:glycosyltransferase involved in cell wall biosynthesis